jgi:ubiquinol-cytochrome c reductase iron-sulfur subunit
VSNEPVRRRDWLVTAAFTTAGVGGVVALWPFVAALNPDQETLARRVTFDTRLLTDPGRAVLEVQNRPIAILRRTEAELASLRDEVRAPRDRDSNQSLQPKWAKNWHRSLRPEIMVFDAVCTRGDCMTSDMGRSDFTMLCPCCGSRYDLAGRVLSGPAPSNLTVPPYRFIDEATIEFVVRDVLAMRASRANPA